MGYLAHVVAMEEISRASASVGLSYGAHSNLCVNQIRRNGTDGAEAPLPAEARLRRARRRAGDERAGRGLGRRVDAPARRAQGRSLRAERQQDVDHQRPGRRHAGRLRQDRRGRRAARHHRASSSRRACTGFSTAQKLDKLGMRGSNTCELVFEDCEVPAENVLGRIGRGVNVLMCGLDYERAVLAGGPLGIMAACLDVVDPLRARAQAVRPADRRVPADAGQARRHVHDDERRARLRVRGGAGLRPRRRRTRARTPPAPSSTPPRRRPGWPARRSSASAATATSTNTRQAACGATPSSTRSAPARREIRRMLIGRELFDDTM